MPDDQLGKIGAGGGTIDQPRGEFTGGDGSTGPVDDDDKMPNPFDDNSPGGPVSRQAISGFGGIEILDVGSLGLTGRF